MVNPYRFYTYAYSREDRTPYYVGKGEGRRVYKKNIGEIKPPKDQSRIIFLKQNLTEEEAFKHEIYMIAVFGRKDLGTGILRNKTDGGDGCSGLIHSGDTRKKLSESNMGENNPNYGKKWWNDGCGNHVRSVECPGEGWVMGRDEETRKKISESNKCKLHTKETKKKMSEKRKGENNSNYGKSHSKETRKKMSELKMGENNSNYGKRWWNDGKGNAKMSIGCPGPNWVSGRGTKKLCAT